MQNDENSSIVPKRRIGTCDSILARTSGSVAPDAFKKAGKSMKFVPTAFTCTPVRATSSATFLTNIVAAARADEYNGAPGVARAPEALVITRT